MFKLKRKATVRKTKFPTTVPYSTINVDTASAVDIAKQLYGTASAEFRSAVRDHAVSEQRRRSQRS